MNKKAFTYTTVSLVAVLVVVSLLSSQQLRARYSYTSITTKLLSDSLNDLNNNLVNDLRKTVEVSISRALITCLNNIVTTGEPLQSPELNISILIVNGTFNGVLHPLMENNTISYWLNNVNLKSNELGFVSEINIGTPSISQNDSFSLLVSYTININTSNKAKTINISRTIDEKVPVSIIGFEDPLFPLNTYGRVERIISRNITSDFNLEKLEDFFAKKNYAPGYGPSFLDRLAGRLYNSYPGSGLETFVDLQELQSYEIDTKPTQTLIDYLYFNSSVIPGDTVTGFSPTWFKIDDLLSHQTFYGVSNLT